MASEVRVNKLTNRSGLGTATFNDDGSITFAGNLNLNNVTTTGRNAGVSTASGAVIFNTTDGIVEVYNGTGWDQLSNVFSATGGTKDTNSRSGWAVHTFTSPGTFTVQGPDKSGEYLVVGGGAGGGNGSGGGGGAGGFRLNTSYTLTPGSYAVVVGGGGAGGGTPGWPQSAVPGSNGTDSEFGTIISAGGGGGGGYFSSGISGASGGGASFRDQTGGSGNVYSPTSPRHPGPAPGQGNAGGKATPSSYDEGGGGGGGAGGAGSNATPSPTTGNASGGPGGNGSPSSITGTNTTYAGGGGGGIMRASTGGTGGPGGGGNGTSGPADGTAGTANTGGGGGGGGRSDQTPPGPSAGLAGGSGIVIIAYPTA